MAGVAQGGQGVDEAGGQPAQAAVAKSGVPLQLIEGLQVLPQVSQALPDHLGDAEVHEVVLQQAPDEELHGEIVDLLLLLRGGLFGAVILDLHRLGGDELGQGVILVGGAALLKCLAQYGLGGLLQFLDEFQFIFEHECDSFL